MLNQPAARRSDAAQKRRRLISPTPSTPLDPPSPAPFLPENNIIDEGGSSTDSEFTGASCKTHDCSGPAVRRSFGYCTGCRTPGAGKNNWLPKSNKTAGGRPLHPSDANPATPTFAALARAVAAPSVVQYGDGTGYNPADYMSGAVGVGDDILSAGRYEPGASFLGKNEALS